MKPGQVIFLPGVGTSTVTTWRQVAPDTFVLGAANPQAPAEILFVRWSERQGYLGPAAGIGPAHL